jgi:hypothetical protein
MKTTEKMKERPARYAGLVGEAAKDTQSSESCGRNGYENETFYVRYRSTGALKV